MPNTRPGSTGLRIFRAPRPPIGAVAAGISRCDTPRAIRITVRARSSNPAFRAHSILLAIRRSGLGIATYVLWQQAFLAQEDWWRSATREVRGMAPRDAARVSFIALQILDIVSPSNVPWLNPVIVDRTAREAGANLVRGAINLSDDLAHTLSMDRANLANGLRVGRILRPRRAKSSFATTSWSSSTTGRRPTELSPSRS